MTQAQRAVSELEIEAVSDLVEVGKDCDGGQVIGERWVILATEADGTRWELAGFGAVSHVQVIDSDGEPGFVATGAADRAEALAARIRAAGSICLDFWREVQPAYGSPAYVVGGWEEIRRAAEGADEFA